MIIRNSKALLEQLSDIEARILKFEEIMSALGIEIDREKLLVIIAGQQARSLPTGQRNLH